MNIKLEKFNNCDPDRIIEFLKDCEYQVQDINRDYWQNCEDTLVILVDNKNLNNLLKIVIGIDCSDETNFIIESNQIILRFWWD